MVWRDGLDLVSPTTAAGGMAAIVLRISSDEPDGALEVPWGSAPYPVSHRAQWAEMRSGLDWSLDESSGSGHSP